MSRLNLILRWNCAVAVVALFPSGAGAFNPAITEPTPASRQQPRDNDRRIVVLDNDYLDRRFGKDRASEANSNVDEQSPPATSGDATITKDPAPRINPAIPVSPNRSLLTAINRATPARRAAALRLAEVGRTSLEKGRKRKAIYYLEKALSVEANAFIHYYLARAHFQTADYQGARRFLEVAEAGFYGWPEWISELAALRAALSSFSLAEQPTLKRNVAWTFDE